MGLLQRAIETYDAMESLAGLYEEGKEPLAPIGHIVTKAHIVITITMDGDFVEAATANKDQKIIIPVTEESSGRTINLAAHPLCEQLGYLLGDDSTKLSLYVQGLEKWVQSEHSHPKAAAVLKYIKNGTMRSDLLGSDISIENDRNMVCWRVVGQEETSAASTWTDVSLMKAYSAYYLSQINGKKQVCMLSGENTFITWQHLKGAFALNGNAKIISANDSANFTYRGRFAKPEEAASVGYIASQKAHNALKWLIGTQGTVQGNRAFVCWNPQGRKTPKLTLPFYIPAKDTTILPTYKSYQEDLRRKIAGYLNEWRPSEQVIVASFDAATTGRLAITYYNELIGSDFLDRLAYWDETCSWIDSSRGVYSPLLYNILCFAFGTQRGEDGKVEPDDKIVAPQMQRLLSCRIDQSVFPLDIMRAIVTKAGNLQVYSDKNRKKLLFTACAVIRKYYIDHQKEAFELALEPERKDRSYQWGRLLAVMEKIETDTYDANENRLPNAIRMQSVFVQRPGYATKVVIDQLKNAYYPKLKGWQRTYYDRLIGEIMEQLAQFAPSDYGKPLTEAYLPGYYLQRNAFFTKKETEETEE